jgi:hypothetical protein
VRFREFVRDSDRYFAQFARAGFDIGLAPMPDDLFYQCKTATKFREYAACGIAGIYANTEMYRDCVTDGETGLLVSQPSALSPQPSASSPQPSALSPSDPWTLAVGRLVTDAALRARIQQSALAYARERYAAARIEGDWLSHIEAAMNARPTQARVAGAARSPERPSVVAGLLRYAGRAASLLSTGGLGAVVTRTRAQFASMRQLVAWELALRRMPRHDHK